MKTSAIRSSGHYGQEPPPAQSVRNAGIVAHELDAISGEKLRMETGTAGKPVFGSDAPAPATQSCAYDITPMIMLRHQDPLLVRRYSRGAANPPDFPGENSRAGVLRMVRQARTQPGPARSASRDNRTEMSSFMRRVDAVFRKETSYPQAGKGEEITANRVTAAGAGDGMSNRRTEGRETAVNGENISRLTPSFAASGDIVRVPLVLSGKSAIHDPFQDVDKKGAEIVEKPDCTPTHGSGAPGFSTGNGIVSFNSVSNRQMIQTTATSRKPYYLLHDVMPFVMRKIASFSPNVMQAPGNPSHEAAGDSQNSIPMSHVIPQPEFALMRKVTKRASWPVAAVPGMATVYLKEQSGARPDPGVNRLIRSSTGSAVAQPVPHNRLMAPEIRRQSVDYLPLASIELNPARVFSNSLPGQMTRGMATQDSRHGYLQRSPDGNGETAQGAATSPGTALGPDDSGMPSGSPLNGVGEAPVNIERIADQVYAIIERRLTLEKERRGL